MEKRKLQSPLLKTKEIIKHLNVSEHYFYNVLLKDVNFPRFKLGKKMTRYCIDDVNRYMYQRMEKEYAEKLRNKY